MNKLALVVLAVILFPAIARAHVPGELIRWQPNDRIRETRCDGETPDDFLGNSAEGDLIS